MRFLGLSGLLFLLAGCWVEDVKNITSSKTESSQEEVLAQESKLTIGEQSFYIETADTSDLRQQGLMYRESMPANRGMLFVWENEQPRTFWMKNTLIPLDMIWINGLNEIVDIQAAEPCKVENCPHYSGKAPAKYVLELNQGVLRATVGDMVDFSSIDKN